MAAPPRHPKGSGPSRRGRPGDDRDFFRRRALPPAPADPDARSLSATISAVVFNSDDGGFTILRGEDPSAAKVVLKGALGHVRVGESVSCTGRWANHASYGWSFQVDTVEVSQPQSLIGMKAYLESSVRGIGPIFAQAIVDAFGEKTFEMIDADPSVLFKVQTPGGVRMSGKRIRAIVEAWDEVREIRRVMVFLSAHSVTPGLANRIHRRYGSESIAVLQENPYRIVEIPGVGFRSADLIARNMNVPLESPQRVQAGILFCLQQAEGKGHCYLAETEISIEASELLTLEDPALITDQLRGLIESGTVVVEAAEDGNRYFLPDTLKVERRLGRNVRAMLGAAPANDAALPARPRGGEFVPNDGQWQAIEHALRHRVSLITGLPGTGKTTLVQLLLRVIEGQEGLGLRSGEARYLLASPTGKAARRLEEATGREAQTIHRLLKWKVESQGKGKKPRVGFEHNEENPLAARFVIVDETSMVDLRLADSLVRAIGPRTHLVLVGDADQLPPVGAGKVFDDLIESGAVPSVRLTEIFRQAAASLIVRNAHRIVSGEPVFFNAAKAAAELGEPEGSINDDFFFVSRESSEEVRDTIVEFAASRIPRRYGLDPIRDVLVLAPMKAGPCGLDELNRALQQRLNPKGTPIGVGRLRVGDRIIQTRNDYGLDVMNGEVGVIRHFDDEDKQVRVEFPDRNRIMSTSDLDSFLPAYAISVHRSQGSQAPAVVCAVAKAHWIMLTRSLANTAITRAQRLCVCVGQPAAMAHAVRTVDARRRNTALAERIVR